MIGISKLYCGPTEDSDALRYARRSRGDTCPRPIVVWNCTKRCNLRCEHCYSASTDQPAPEELTGAEARAMIDDLAAFGAPVLLFSGGEPLLRDDLMELVSYAGRKKLRTVLSTNGTLITAEIARQLAEAKLAYVGISLDGLETVNDAFRGRGGAFQAALGGIRHCRQAGIKVGLRMTISRRNLADVTGVFDLVEREDIPRVCFYHLVSVGRGAELGDQSLSAAETRSVLDIIMDRTAALHKAGKPVQVLTVDNHADGPYVQMRLAEENPDRADRCMELLRLNGGNSSGERIACISWNGDVLPDQFWRQHVLGNVRDRRFSDIWQDPNAGDGLLARLRDRKNRLQCRCRNCRWLDVCNGNFRARAEAAGNGIWGDDPACYLTDDEIA